MNQSPRHKVFISFYHDDQSYKNLFARMMEYDIVDKSVEDGDIDENLKVETIRQKIRDDFIADATVTVVLIGPATWQRKYVDWEIGSSIRDTRNNSRCGLLGILLPNHPDFGKVSYRPRLIPERLAANANSKENEDPYAAIFDWKQDANTVRDWIHRAFVRRNGPPPKNNTTHYRYNRSGHHSRGWQN